MPEPARTRHIPPATIKNQIACPKINIPNPCRSGVKNPEQIPVAVTRPKTTPEIPAPRPSVRFRKTATDHNTTANDDPTAYTRANA